MVQKQLAAVESVAVVALLLVLLGALWSQGSAPLTDVEEPGTHGFSEGTPSMNMTESCAPCHGPVFDFEGPLLESDDPESVHENGGSDRSAEHKPP
jgi:hypothetical protein